MPRPDTGLGRRAFVLGALGSAAAAAFRMRPARAETAPADPAPGLKYYLGKIRPGFDLGVYFPENPAINHRAALFVTANFTFATAGVFMKATQPAPGEWDLTDVDTKIGFLRDAGLKVCLHHGIGWNVYNPQWLTGRKYSRDQLQAILEGRIRTLLTRYRDKIWLFHVVNEAYDRDGKWRDAKYNVWTTLGWHGGDGGWPTYVEQAFRMARRDGGAGVQLIYTDNNNAMLNSIKAGRTFELFLNFRNAGIPIDGVGFQFHTAVKNGELREGSNGEGVRVDFESFTQNMRRFAAAGATVHVTEFDVHLPEHATAREYQIQADAYREALKRCVEEPSCGSFASWGSSDHNWGTTPASGSRPPAPHAMMLDDDYRPKPAYDAMLQYLQTKSGVSAPNESKR